MKMFFWQKDPKKENGSKCKINKLVHLMLFGIPCKKKFDSRSELC